MGAGAAPATPVARILDPSVLRAPLRANDPRATLRHLWRMGARGPLVEVTGLGHVDDGMYLLVENWDRLAATRAPGIGFTWDRRLLRRIRDEAARGLVVVVHARVPQGAFAVNTDNTFYGLLAPLVPRLAEGPYVGVNGYTNLYLFEHELAHHEDHASGRAEETWAEVRGEMSALAAPGQPLEPLWFFMAEARAFDREMLALEASRRPFEFAAYDGSDEFTTITRVDGPRYRARRVRYLIRAFNADYAAALDAYPAPLRERARAFFFRTIEHYGALFDDHDRMRPTCARALLAPHR